MKRALALICALLCGSLLRAQAPSSNPQQTQPPPASNPQTPLYLSSQNPTAPQGPVPISEEPHHRLVLQNDFTHVYNVMVPALDFTLLHQHDLPYLYVVLGPADIINAVVGKPELHQVLQDGETHYNPGHFAHIVRTDSGVPFHNITIELVRPQGTAQNLCSDVLPGAPLNCPGQQQAAAEKTKGKQSSKKSRAVQASERRKSELAAEKRNGEQDFAQVADNDAPYFETDEIRVDLHKVSGGADYVDPAPKVDALLVALTNANLDANLAGEHIQFLHGGDVLWLPAGQHRRIVDFLGTHSSFLLISFKDSAHAPAQ
jgi:hypothetical protein